MNRFEILEHTGDVKIRVCGRTQEELFQNAMEGMFHILNPEPNSPAGGKNLKKRTIKIQALDINALLVDFLNEVNYLRQVHGETYGKVYFQQFSDTALEVELEGDEVREFGEDIKAATFHDLDIHQNKKGEWETDIVFDV
ncbi:MAG: hypothetical protein A3J30_03260 [Candidatus Wildermuthbacteria bacterium RIFCSPLOWO2_02_FULL_47_9c]|uniref:Archease domain-containing protein n=2 Tax=Parcubacteria group TaxID=1794811 RepID=A0A837IPK7_9BACT|nr:MAG: hypothetical protein UY25_C0004G0069 [Candidatus Yanofskybacteria bacterium GW2011_GWC1_48_11]KKW04495.1 MAG: hypothetical protein UY38_C0001G0062 [Parcubacteria group bacterium GW2011_GWB1_49_12]KKW09248.1 MAG: hypothetical protein UY45_C0001G0134 [Parcubacteria group bacterium GW2011_GWA1_49_26]KKW14113.1 MAG: hypothetical protein UY53_C0003G0033 [Parcubacteria group bacterium GW2011_GWA2_50_10]OHA61497.1 MAG: hypothetical protein A2109_01300 [Candidatus Wildermuthbacteria bacterium G